ncbi:ATP-binding protein [Paracoccus sp. Ld10]|uniref:ATP-binding protein n=1 Tax=Paracoccus sp. Ld10 TaxID=649158 RepID=UPI00386E9DE7
MSLRTRLSLILILSTGLIWVSAMVWINSSTRAQVQTVLDARLEESANMLGSLIREGGVTFTEPFVLEDTSAGGDDPNRLLYCQVWSLRGELVGASAGAPNDKLAQTPGLVTSIIDGEPWRVFTAVNSELGLRIMVGDRITVRDSLVSDVMRGLVWPALVVIPALTLLIWVVLGRGLSPLAKLESALRARGPDDLSPLPAARDPREIRPIRRALNQMFEKLDHVRRTERDFTAFAAHELKTPLAGMRMQAQIARRAPDEASRNRALEAIETSVDRSDRMVRQLLDLTFIDYEAADPDPLVPSALLDEAAANADLQAQAAKVTVLTVTHSLPMVHIPKVLIQSALRNLVENAIQHSPGGGTVTLSARHEGEWIVFSVRDEGLGIDPAHRDRVTERFWRGPGTMSQGSGLGLSIVAAAVQRMSGRLTFGSSQEGQEVRIHVPLSPD